MPELSLAEDFPPVSTADWEAAIRADLKGADYEKRLVWRTEEGLAVRPYYRAEDLAGLPAYPCARERGNDWKIAQNDSLALSEKNQSDLRQPLPDGRGSDVLSEPGPGGAPSGSGWPFPNAIRGDWLHESGANAVQEVAYALAAAVERLAQRTSDLMGPEPVDAVAAQFEFVFAAGPVFFVEIAKFRAARLLWAQVLAAFGMEQPESCRMRVTARTPRRNKSRCDRYNNLLRVTTEALAAVIGGCDSLMVEPFGFDAHLALNVQHILREEAHLDAVSDPAGGSYYIEWLTAALAREAWRLFQQVEAEGGFSESAYSGSYNAALAESRAAQEKAVFSRKRTLVGVNNYPNLTEKTLDAAAPETGHARLAEPFEKIRERTAQIAGQMGRYPRVLLLERGDLKMRMARANFCLNFFGCAGFDLVEADELEGAEADLIVLCSSDAEYLGIAREVCTRTAVPVVVAGNPKDQIEALEAAGVKGFVHAQSDAIQTLTEWQERLDPRSRQ